MWSQARDLRTAQPVATVLLLLRYVLSTYQLDFSLIPRKASTCEPVTFCKTVEAVDIQLVWCQGAQDYRIHTALSQCGPGCLWKRYRFRYYAPATSGSWQHSVHRGTDAFAYSYYVRIKLDKSVIGCSWSGCLLAIQDW